MTLALISYPGAWKMCFMLRGGNARKCFRTRFENLFIILGDFANLWKATSSFFMSVRPSAWDNSAPTGRILINFHIWVFFEYVSRKCKFKIGQEQGVLYVKANIQCWSYLAQFFLELEMFQTKVVEKIKTRILCSIFFFENRAVYEIMWKKECWAGQPTDDNMAHVYRMATNTHSEYVILIAFPLQ